MAYRYYSIRRADGAIVMGIMTFVVCFAADIYWLSAVGMGAFTYYLVRLILETGEDITIENFILVIASLQWIVGPTLSYAMEIDHFKYHMYVSEEQYMELAVPSVILYSLGLYFFRPRKRAIALMQLGAVTRDIINSSYYIPYYLIGIGFAFSFVMPHVPASLLFIFHVLSNLKYVGIIYILFSDRYRNKTLVVIVAFLLSLMSSLNKAMFHDLILWFSFIGMYYALIDKPSLAKKLFIIVLVVVGLFLLQTAKQTYREALQQSGKDDLLGTFTESVDKSLEKEDKLQGSNTEKLVNRINQGWIISRILETVPDRVEHADGETVLVALKASLLPRVLFPDKPVAGGRENYEKYTRFDLTSSTSMGISLLGEAYINYGLQGAWAFMFLIGLAFSYGIKRLFKLVRVFPTFWLWLPLILLHFVKAETELLVQLNYLIKSSILIIAFLYANKMFLKIRL